jgi:hypothetical protein
MTSAERQKFLLQKKPQHRQFMEAKLIEFDALTPEQRETRLQSLQLRYYLSLLMKLPATNRSSILHGVPPPDRPLVEERLRRWDQLTAEEQKLFLEHEAEVRRQVSEAGPMPRGRVLDTHTPFDLALMEKQIRSWNALSEEKRHEVESQFQQFFELPPNKKGQIRDNLNQVERNALTALDRLPEEERERCLEGFRKFRRLSPEQRHEFLKAAARWKKMDEQQRQTWRKLADKLPPDFPLPPEFNRPPLPPGLNGVRVSGASSSFATN